MCVETGIYILEVATKSLDSIESSICSVLNELPTEVQVLPPDAEFSLQYVPTEMALAQVVKQLGEGAWRSLRILPSSGIIPWAIVYAPHFAGSNRSWWSFVFEQKGGDPIETWNRLISAPNLHFAALSLEDSLDDELIGSTVNSFPWGDYRLAIAGLVDDKGDLVIRRGPAFEKVRI
jgi:hypothetical protein